MEIPEKCSLCPRACGADRRTQKGICGGAGTVKLARAALHFGEEPCISGTRGSGTVFFNGCALKCVYCQNYKISAENYGKEIGTAQLADIFLALQAQGAHNINLVSAQHYLPWVLDALQSVKAQLHIPVVYNTGGYETTAAVQALAPYVDVWLTDLKYVSPVLSDAYSHATDYFTVASAALQTMLAAAGAPVYDENGLLVKGVLVRHLALPNALDDTKAVLQYLAALPKNSFVLSLVCQYTPCYKAKNIKVLNRRLSTYEYNRALDTAIELGLANGYMQQRSSAKEEYTPVWDLTGV